MWIDYTRRNDPACPAGLNLFEQKLARIRKRPDVVCFWTKNPRLVGELYKNHIESLRTQGTIILAQVTINPGYQDVLEPGINETYWEMSNFIDLLGGPQHVRMRFDPIIPGYTTPGMFRRHCEIAARYGITHTTVNFLIPGYKNVGQTLMLHGIRTKELTTAEKADVLNHLVEMAGNYGIKIAVCAESAGLAQMVPDVLPARCADPDWAIALGANGEFRNRPSRKGCGCCYSADWGQYENGGGYRCPHRCLYCYAKA